MKKTAVITGANAGLGYAISVELARRGMAIVMACRNQEKAAKARAALLEQVPDGDARVMSLDVSEPDSIEAFAANYSLAVGELDLLVNNAGIVGMPLARNSRGQEMHLATNYLGAFALTGRLLPQFRTGASSRIVNVGSLAHLFGRLNLEDFNWEAQPYNQWGAYARSKLALLTFTLELHRRLTAAGSPITVLAAHPGFAATEILGERANPVSGLRKWYTDRMKKLVPTPEAAARSILHAACAQDVQGGDYYGPGGFLGIAGAPAKARLAGRAKDANAARALWTLSESLCGLSYL